MRRLEESRIGRDKAKDTLADMCLTAMNRHDQIKNRGIEEMKIRFMGEVVKKDRILPAVQELKFLILADAQVKIGTVLVPEMRYE